MEFLEKYNPANASKLTDEDISAMKDLTDDQINQLADQYPNKSTGNAYLVYFNASEKDEQQKFPMGTWENLRNLRKLGRKEFSAAGFSKKFVAPVQKATAAATNRIIDLAANDANKAEGLKSSTPELPEYKETTVDAAKFINADDVLKTDVNDQLLENAGTATEEPLYESNPLLTAYNEAVAELEQAKEDRAHHMTIKSLKEKVDAAKLAAGL